MMDWIAWVSVVSRARRTIRRIVVRGLGALAAQMEHLFKRDKANAGELTLTTWQARPWYAKVSERVLAPPGVFM